jgi:large subunit ribosomal protein L20
MSRVKKGVAAKKHKKYLLKRAKGYLNGASSKFRLAKERLFKAESNAYISRKLRKRDFRKLWISRINGALDQIQSDLSYSKLIGLIKKNNFDINRKSLSQIANSDIESFKKLITEIQSGSLKVIEKTKTTPKKVVEKISKTKEKVIAKKTTKPSTVKKPTVAKTTTKIKESKPAVKKPAKKA